VGAVFFMPEFHGRFSSQKGNFVGELMKKIPLTQYQNIENNTTKLPRHFTNSSSMLRGSFF